MLNPTVLRSTGPGCSIAGQHHPHRAILARSVCQAKVGERDDVLAAAKTGMRTGQRTSRP